MLTLTKITRNIVTIVCSKYSNSVQVEEIISSGCNTSTNVPVRRQLSCIQVLFLINKFQYVTKWKFISIKSIESEINNPSSAKEKHFRFGGKSVSSVAK